MIHQHLPPGPPARANSVLETCQRLGVSRTLFYTMVQRGHLRVVKLGARTLVPEAEIQRLLNAADDRRAVAAAAVKAAREAAHAPGEAA